MCYHTAIKRTIFCLRRRVNLARKAVLEGGKREEILNAALVLFLQHGYEATSIRMILEQVHGEVGMFYHYFSSKQAVFDQAFALFMKRQSEQLSLLMERRPDGEPPRERLARLAAQFDHSMEEYRVLSGGSIHWTAVTALHDMALEAMLPAFQAMLGDLYQSAGMAAPAEAALLGRFLLHGIGGVLHGDATLPEDERLRLIVSLLCRVTGIPQALFEQ
jgi:AcrR family transcriptional regulator